MAHPDVAREQEHLDRAVRALTDMAGRTGRALAGVESAATEADSEVARFHLRRRLESLDAGDAVLAFGRIDEAADRWYVGRRHVEDDAGDPLVVDWRAPVSIPFYRATAHDPLGLDRRRRFLAEGPAIVDILEEDFADPDGALVSGGVPDPLLAELERARTGSMRDIVATIAAEQDEIIRAPLGRLLIVQGGPGTGKTAVALHRAAYLLFEHRLRLLERGVLVVGPNQRFLRYVADVLPSLGETAVRQTTIEGLRPPSVRLDEGAAVDPARGSLLGDLRMVAVIDAAVRATVRIPTEEAAVSTAWGVVRIRPDEVAAAVDDIHARGVPHKVGKEALRNQLLHRAYELHEQSAETPALKANFLAAARADAGVRAVLDRIWPTASAPALVQRLLRSRAARRAGAGVLDATELDLLARDVPGKVADVRWHPSEIPLLDEAEQRIQGTRTTYGHVIVDEAQDLSALALRMLGRRAEDGSATVVGDLAQATTAWSQRSWDDVVGALGIGHHRYEELTVGYRTPAPILDLANRLLPDAAPDVTPARSIRETGEEPELRAVAGPDEVAAAVRAVVDEEAGRPGTLAVVAPASLVGALGEAAGTGPVLTPLEVKGLEFDVVVVVEPAAIVRAEPAGARALFVALSRPTRRLVVVHAEPLPAAISPPG